jgi:chaperonin GroEL
MTFENADISVIGTARKVIVTKDDSTIVEGAGSAADIKKRIAQINGQIEAASSEYDREQLEKRRAALSGKVAVIKVGGATETEIEEKKFRVDDAVHAVKAALDDGIVAGGGVTLINLIPTIVSLADKKLQGKKTTQRLISEDAGMGLLARALEQPFRVLLENSGLNPDEWLPQIRSAKPGYGVDVNDSTKLVDLKAAGIVDPARVAREAIQNAVSIAGTAITMGALVVDVPEKTPAMPSPDMGGGMGMM